MSYSQYFLHNLMDMGSLLGTILGTILDYTKLQEGILCPLFRVPQSARLIFTAAHVHSSQPCIIPVSIPFSISCHSILHSNIWRQARPRSMSKVCCDVARDGLLHTLCQSGNQERRMLHHTAECLHPRFVVAYAPHSKARTSA